MKRKTLQYILLLVLFTALGSNALQAADFYWRGGSGTWSDISHWKTSGGASYTNAPTKDDNVFFDDQSGLVAGSAVTIDADASALDLTFDCLAPPKLIIKANMYIHGSLIFQDGMEIEKPTDPLDNTNYTISFLSNTTGNKIKTWGATFYHKFLFNGSGGEWTLMDNLTIVSSDYTNPPNQRGISVNQGKLILDGKTYTGFYFHTNNTASISMKNATVNVSRWEYNSTQALTRLAATSGSTINLSQKKNYHSEMIPKAWLKTNAATDQYNIVDVVAGGWVPIKIYSGNFDRLSFTGANGTLAEGGTITTNTLQLYAPGKYELKGDITVNTTLDIRPFGSSGCGGFIELCSFNPTVRRTIKGSPGTVRAESVLITDIALSGGPRTAIGLDGGNNDGWTITPITSGVTRTWKGGAGRWNDPAHWSGSCVPTPFDNVVFDGTSGLASGDQVLIDMTAYAHDLTFKGGNPPLVMVYFPIEIHGSLELQKNMKVEKPEIFTTLTASLVFRSTDTDEKITMNGVKLNEVPIYFNSFSQGSATGTGKWTFQDDIELVSKDQARYTNDMGRFNGIQFQSGHLDFNKRTVTAFRFYSGVDGGLVNSEFNLNNSRCKTGRTLNIAGATIHLKVWSKPSNSGGWLHVGGAALTEEQTKDSKIIIDNISGNFFQGKPGDQYNELECLGSGIGPSGDVFGFIKSGKHKKITIGAAHAQIFSLETDELIFTTHGKYKMKTPDSPVKVNKLLKSSSCGGAIIIYSEVPGSPRKFEMGAAGVVDLSNLSLTDIHIGPSTYTVKESVDLGGNKGWTFNTGTPKEFYWVGGTGNWSDPNNWAHSSGETQTKATCIPGLTDNVTFDKNSFSASGQTVKLDGTAFCNNMKWIDDDGKYPVFNMAGYGIQISGSLELKKGMEISGMDPLNDNYGKAMIFTSSRSMETIKTNGVKIPCHMIFEGRGGWKLLDELYQTGHASQSFLFKNGHLDFNGQKVSINSFTSTNTTNPDRTLKIAGSIITITGYPHNPWQYTGGAALTYEDTKNSTIIVGPAGQYATPNIFEAKVGDVYYNLESTRPNFQIKDATFNKVYLDEHTTINNIVTDTLWFEQDDHTFQFTAGNTSTINKAWFASGNNCHPNSIIKSTSETILANVNILSDAANYTEVGTGGETLQDNILLMDYVSLRNMNALTGTGKAIPKLGSASNHDAASTNWLYAPKGNNISSGLDKGPTIRCEFYAYTIRSAGMVPTPKSIVEWYKEPEGFPDPETQEEKLRPIQPSGNAVLVSTDFDIKVKRPTDAGVYWCVVDYVGDGTGCKLAKWITVKAADVGYLIWNGRKGNQDWHDYGNWELTKGNNDNPDNAIPSKCVSVLIPDGINNYPDLTKTSLYDFGDSVGETNEPACDIITFEHGGEVLRTDLLNYSEAIVELELNSSQWYMLSAPLHDTYSGDLYVNKPERYEDGYLVYPMLFNQDNPQTDSLQTGTQYLWSNSFNNVDREFALGEGFALWVKGNDPKFTFPKDDEQYYIYSIGNQEKVDSVVAIDRTYLGRFIYERSPLSGEIVTLPEFTGAAVDEYILVGNPFMCHLKIREFLLRNSPSIDPGEFTIAYGESTTEGKVDSYVTFKWDGTNYKNKDNETMDLIAPMQSFLVKAKSANPTLTVDIKDTKLLPGDKLR
ncbi:hypothetical protein M2132_001958 [Dysgonomonas sp. PH5-45]|uniref:hypothetical protein n=1 Tax=unclassified Dysgonomonas TaxID=2630389 RepID=UPI0024752873|nr:MULTISPECIES: hypothetical protein [unclassified Dysgonomonas]MDH6355613.1 hypothetical protein [Dysgonomonas sp. PH5-45]MDH6388477.1 hypothetical protein [Dysgonomonas sp. PH5-37]